MLGKFYSESQSSLLVPQELILIIAIITAIIVFLVIPIVEVGRPGLLIDYSSGQSRFHFLSNFQVLAVLQQGK